MAEIVVNTRSVSEVASRIGAVVIGRNEGARLQECLESIGAEVGEEFPVVYVDSGSTDDSVSIAQQCGAEVVDLEPSVPFTAARARNAGLERLRALFPSIDYVLFLDGDCSLEDGFLDVAQCFLDEHPKVAVVCGRRLERYPDRSAYNLLCDLEWAQAPGEARACGGDALVRISAMHEVRGFRADLIAGEEPELCARLRAKGWHIWRLNRKMSLHDAGMTRFSQWWRRSVRAGHAYAQGAYLHGGPPEYLGVRDIASSVVWAVVVPAAVLAGLLLGSSTALVLVLLYPMQVLRLTLTGPRSLRVNLVWSFFLVLGKFAEVVGNLKFLFVTLPFGRARLIEYK